jgi:hypothetical protein
MISSGGANGQCLLTGLLVDDDRVDLYDAMDSELNLQNRSVSVPGADRMKSTTKSQGARAQKPRGEGKLVRIEPELANKARIIALRRGIYLSEYVSNLIRSPVLTDYRATLQELSDEDCGKK